MAEIYIFPGFEWLSESKIRVLFEWVIIFRWIREQWDNGCRVNQDKIICIFYYADLCIYFGRSLRWGRHDFSDLVYSGSH